MLDIPLPVYLFKEYPLKTQRKNAQRYRSPSVVVEQQSSSSIKYVALGQLS